MQNPLPLLTAAAVAAALFAADAQARWEVFGAGDEATVMDSAASDLDFAMGVAGAFSGTKPAIATPGDSGIDPAVHSDVLFHEILAIGQGQAAQGGLDAAEDAVASLASLPGRGEDRTKRADADQELKCLTQAVYFEARGESIDGQIAVAEVILNRAESPKFPDTVCGVISQGAHRLNACQFSYMCDGKPEKMTEPRAKERAQDVALLLLKGERRAITQEATFYHADYVSPRWSRKMVKTAAIGTHIFYRPKPTQVASN